MSYYDEAMEAMLALAEKGQVLNNRGFALLCLAWEDKRRQLDEIEALMKEYVLRRGKTFTVGNVQARFSKGRTTYDYEGAIFDYSLALTDDEKIDAMHNAEESHGEMVLKVDWKAVCEELEIEPKVKKEPVPSVTLALLEEDE